MLLCKLVSQSDLSASRQQEQSSWWVGSGGTGFGTGSGVSFGEES
jgi:hypothetical protein